MPTDQSGTVPSIPIFSANAEAKAAEALNVLIFAHGGGEEEIVEDQLSTLRWSLTGLVDCLFPIKGDYADFGGADSLDGIDYVHPTRVATLAAVIGRMMGMQRTALIKLALAAALMNIGYLALRRSLLDQPRRLLEGEWEEHIHTHPDRGVKLLAESGLADECIRAVAQHHERWDSSRYPAGVEGESISPFARILAVADTYVSLRSVRPHRPPVNAETALEEIAAGRGKFFDPDVVDAFEDAIAQFSGIMRASRAESVATASASVDAEEYAAAQRDGTTAAEVADTATIEPGCDMAGEEELLSSAPAPARRARPREAVAIAGERAAAARRLSIVDGPPVAAPRAGRRAAGAAPPAAAQPKRRHRPRRSAPRRHDLHRGLFAPSLYVDASLSGRWPVERASR